jgi:glycosyltransferase involved in cell wall biosynthesis
MSTSLPSISLVTPSLNQGRFIRATIESVLSQEYPALEYFVQDGGSTDGTLDLLAAYAGRVPFVSEPDRGQADAINRGLRRSHGEVVGYLNSDDLLRPGALRAVGEAFAARPDVVFVWGRATYVEAEGTTVSPCLVRSDAWGARILLHSSRQLSSEGPLGRRWGVRRDAPPHDGLRLVPDRGAVGPAELFLDRELAGAASQGSEDRAGWDRASRRSARLWWAGYVSLWWCVAKWDHRLDGRSQATGRIRAVACLPPALLEFLRRNPPGFWPRGVRAFWRGLKKKIGSN